jgi:cobalt-zinc-cadmium efflux system membrane fusion protein
MKRYKYFIACCLTTFILSGCGNNDKPGEATASEDDQLLKITQGQFELNKMKIGPIVTSTFTEEVKCNGYIKAPTGTMAQLGSPVAGTVETIHCSMGDFVKKGQVLCTLYNNEVIILQQELVETAARLSRLKSDYERSKLLLSEKVSAEKDFIAIESEYLAMKAKYQSARLRLEILNLDAEKIEAGEQFVTFPVTAPLSGYITTQFITLGQFVDQQKIIMEIVDISKLHLQFSVYESSVSKLKVGQDIFFKTAGEKDSLHHAILTSVGRAIDMESRSIQCIAKIIKEDSDNFVNNAYVDAYVIVDEWQNKALPNEALGKSGPDYYIFVVAKESAQDYYVKKVRVRIGKTSGGMTEITDDLSLNRIIVEGAYNLKTE